MSIRQSGTRQGFTVFELLVVIWIIITLIAILLPVFTKAKHTAQIRKWQAALKQLSGNYTL